MNLCGTDLYWIDISEIDLRETNLYNMNLRGINLHNMNLHGINEINWYIRLLRREAMLGRKFHSLFIIKYVDYLVRRHLI